MVKNLKTENKVKLTPSDARAIWECKHSKDHSNLVVDYSLFYKNHCKVHPIDPFLIISKKLLQRKRNLFVIFTNPLYSITLITKKRKSRDQRIVPIIFGRNFFIKQLIMNGKKRIGNI